MSYPGQYAQAAPAQSHQPVPVMVDTTGDGVANAVGYDTNGDGHIDAIDYDGDGVIDARVPPTQPVQGYAAPPPAYVPNATVVGMSAPPSQGYAAPARANMPTSVPQSGGRGGYVQQPAYQQVAPSYQAPQVGYVQQPAYQQPQQPVYQQPQQPAYQQPAYQQPAYQQPQQPAYQAPQASAPPAQAASSGGGQLLDFRSQDQKNVANNPDAVALKGQDGLLIAGKAANKQGPSTTAKVADKAAVGAAVVGVGAVGAGVAVAATDPGLLEGAVGAIGSVGGDVIGAVGGLIGGLFK